MDFALFHTPFDRPERNPKQIFDYGVEQAIAAEQAGFTEYWVGEHSTLTWEAIPNPELVIAAAARQTDRIKLCPGAHLLPYHDPATLAVRCSWLTHITEGRYILGVGAGAFPTDAALHGLTDLSQNHHMVAESLDIMLRVWEGEPFQHEGKYFKGGFPETPEGGHMRDWRPYGGKMEIALAGISPDSPTLVFAGSRGYLPLSIFAGEATVRNHWEVYEAAARDKGLKVSRQDLRVAREVFCADTDKEAKRRAIEGMGRAWAEYLLPVYKQVGLIDRLIPDPNVDKMKVDVDFLAEHVWIVGSPETVAEKLEASLEANGGYGTTLVFAHDFMDDPAPWNESMERLAKEVAPRITAPKA
ncbi:MAG: LLM class flavin-dependent oxidoreductase [Acidimicrobiia bacterium]